MKITIVMLASLNGVITTGPGDDLSWGGSLDKKNFSQFTKQIGTVVMGSKTFEAIGRSLPGRRNIVMTSRAEQLAKKWGNIARAGGTGEVEFSSLSPAELASQLKAEGLEHIAVIGGAQINTAFLEAGLVTAIRLTIAPVIIPGSTGVFTAELLKKYQLDLANTQQLSDDALVLEYDLKQSS